MSSRLLYGFFFIVVILTLKIIPLNGQNAPVTTAATLDNVTADTIDIPLTVTGFTNIGAVSLSIDYDYSVLHFINGTPHPQLPSFPTGELDLGTGIHRVTMGWFGTAKTLPDGSAIMTLHFTFSGGITSLTFFDNGPSCEYADGNYNVLNDIPAEQYYINGNVCGVMGLPGPVTGDNVVCAGSSGITYSVDQVENATGFAWAVPPGATIVNGQGTNLITVDYAEDSQSGVVTVTGTNPCGDGETAQLDIQVNALPVAGAGNDTVIPYGTYTTLHAQPGGPGTYAFHWSPEEMLVNPDMQNPQTVNMELSTLFTLLVTDLASQCLQSDEMTVTISGGPLSANPVAVPAVICQGSASQLHANAGGGSGNYSYSWTCQPAGSPPWGSTLPDPVVIPDSSRLYQVVVNDGFNVTTGSTALVVSDLPSAIISGSDTLCGDDVYANLRVDLTGTPPWSFTYSYGNTSVCILNQESSPYIIITDEPGDYIITAVDDEVCSGLTYGTAIVRKYPVPAKPEITIYETELISSSCCGNQWYKNGALIPGATSQTYQVTQNGQYFVIVTLNSCSSEPSDTVDMIVGIPEYNIHRLLISPNPSKDRITISLDIGVQENISLALYAPTGILVKEIPFSSRTRQENIIVDLAGLPEGLYFIIINTPDKIYSGKFIRNH